MMKKEHYIDLVEYASDIIQSVNPQEKFEYVNKTWKQKLGYNDEEIKNITLWDIIHSKSLKHCKEVFEEVMKGRHSGYVEASFISKDKKEIFVEGNVNCRLDEKGDIIATRAIFRDVTQRRKLQKQLEESVDKLSRSNDLQKVLLDVSTTFVDNKNTDLNKQINQSLNLLGKGLFADRIFIFEYDFENNTASNIYEWSNDKIESQIDNLQNIPLDIISDWVQKHKQGQIVNIDDVLAIKSNKKLYKFLNSQDIQSVVAVPMTKDGRCFGFIGFDSVRTKKKYTQEEINHLIQIGNIYVSIIQRKEVQIELDKSREQYKSLVENLDEVIYVLDIKGNISYVSPNVKALTGYSPDELIGKSFLLLAHQDDKDNRISEFENILIGKQKPTEYRYLTKDKKEMWVKTNAKPIYANNTLVGIQGALTDITDLKNTQYSLTENTRFLNTVLESIQEGLVVINEDYTIDYMNPAMKKWNARNKDAINAKCYKLLKNRNTPCKNCIKDRCLQKNQPQKGLEKYNTPSGIQIVEIYCYPFREEDGKVRKVVEFIVDVTEKKNIEQKLIDSEEQNRRLISQMQQGLLVGEAVYDSKKDIKDLKVISINKSFEKISGITKKSLVGKGLYEFFGDSDKEWFKEFEKVVIYKKPIQNEGFSESMKKWLTVSVYSPQKDQFAVIIEDISDKKLLENSLYYEKEQIRATLLSVGDGVIAVDKELKITLINRVAEQLTGWKRKEAVGKDFEKIFNVIDEKTRKKAKSITKTVFEKGKSIKIDMNRILISKNNSEFPIEKSVAPIKNRNGSITGAVVVFRNIKERKEKQEKILYLSYHDQLTGLYNRRFFDENIARMNKDENLPFTIVMLDVNGLKLVNDAFGHFAGDRLLKKVSSILLSKTRPEDLVVRVGGDEFVVIMPKTSQTDAMSIMKEIMEVSSASRIEGMQVSISYGWETKTNQDMDFLEMYKKAEDHMYRRKLSESQSMRHNAVDVILKTLYEKSEREQRHSKRVSGFCVDLGKALGLGKEELKEIKTAGLMHDIGKIIVPDDVLNKKEKLSKSDWITIKRHPETGYKILSAVNEFAFLAKEVLQHHEKWDGTGYPEGLKGEKIEFKARIIAVADAYDAMTTDRPYRKALTKKEAIRELEKNAGTQFDPYIVKVFVNALTKKSR